MLKSLVRKHASIIDYNIMNTRNKHCPGENIHVKFHVQNHVKIHVESHVKIHVEILANSFNNREFHVKFGW